MQVRVLTIVMGGQSPWLLSQFYSEHGRVDVPSNTDLMFFPTPCKGAADLTVLRL